MSLAHKRSKSVSSRIWAASYDPKREALRVSLEAGGFMCPKFYR